MRGQLKLHRQQLPPTRLPRHSHHNQPGQQRQARPGQEDQKQELQEVVSSPESGGTRGRVPSVDVEEERPA